MSTRKFIEMWKGSKIKLTKDYATHGMDFKLYLWEDGEGDDTKYHGRIAISPVDRSVWSSKYKGKTYSRYLGYFEDIPKLKSLTLEVMSNVKGSVVDTKEKKNALFNNLERFLVKPAIEELTKNIPLNYVLSKHY